MGGKRGSLALSRNECYVALNKETSEYYYNSIASPVVGHHCQPSSSLCSLVVAPIVAAV